MQTSLNNELRRLIVNNSKIEKENFISNNQFKSMYTRDITTGKVINDTRSKVYWKVPSYRGIE